MLTRMFLLSPPAGGPTWTDILTAIGTVGAVIAAVGIALWSNWRTRKQLAEDRRRALEREQIAEAYAVLVLSAERIVRVERDAEGRDGAVKQLAVLIVNRSSYTINESRGPVQHRHQPGDASQSRPAWRVSRNCPTISGQGGLRRMSLSRQTC